MCHVRIPLRVSQWCYVGKKRLDKAMAAKPDVRYNIRWHPFIIDRGTAKEGEGMEAYCGRRWGGSGWTNAMRRDGKRDGAVFAEWNYWPNTLHAHRCE